MFDWMIAALEGAQADGAWGEAQLLGMILSPLVAVTAAAWVWATLRYQDDIRDAARLRDQVTNRDATIRTLEREIAPLRAASPAAFLARHAAEAQGDNWEQQVAAAHAFLDPQREALTVAWRTLAQEAVGHAPQDGAAGFKAARLCAMAALAATPDDAALRDLVDDLRAAAAAAAGGATVRLRPDAARAEARRQRAAVPDDLAALYRCYFDAEIGGRYRLAVAFAAHAERLARRAAPAGAAAIEWAAHLAWAEVQAGDLVAGLHRAEQAAEAARGLDATHPVALDVRRTQAFALRRCGQPRAALTILEALTRDAAAAQGRDAVFTLAVREEIADCRYAVGETSAALDDAQALLPDQSRVLGADHPSTLQSRWLIAACLSDMGEAAAALDDARALLPDHARVLSADHPDTLATRRLIATCLRDTGEVAAALDDARALLPDRTRVLGADHPDTLRTRTLEAGALMDLGRVGEAAAAHDGVVAALRAKGLAEEARSLREALACDARIAAARQGGGG